MATRRRTQYEAHALWAETHLRRHPQTRHLAVRVSWNDEKGMVQLDGPVPLPRDRTTVESVVQALNPRLPVLNQTYVVSGYEGTSPMGRKEERKAPKSSREDVDNEALAA